MSPDRWARARRAAFWVYVPILLTLTLWPKLRVPGPERSDLVAHFGAFGLLTGLMIGAAFFGSPLAWRNILLPIPIIAAAGACDEWLQAIPFFHRTCALDDWCANMGGVSLAVIGAIILRKLMLPGTPVGNDLGA